MKNKILEHIKISKENGEKLLAILLDPDKLSLQKIEKTILKINKNKVDFIFVGGSTVAPDLTTVFVEKVKKITKKPIVLFPGHYTQLTNAADAVLFLSLLSGRNSEFLVTQHVKSVPFLKKSSLEVIPTGYILIDGGVETSVQKVSETMPILQLNTDAIVNTAIAAELMGKQLVYLEAGSGAKEVVNQKIIKEVSKNLNIPLIVGGGIRTKTQLEKAYKNGADIVVIGTAFEENIEFLKEIK